MVFWLDETNLELLLTYFNVILTAYIPIRCIKILKWTEKLNLCEICSTFCIISDSGIKHSPNFFQENYKAHKTPSVSFDMKVCICMLMTIFEGHIKKWPIWGSSNSIFFIFPYDLFTSKILKWQKSMCWAINEK